MDGLLQRSVSVNLFSEERTAAGISLVIEKSVWTLTLYNIQCAGGNDYLTIFSEIVFPPDNLVSRRICRNVTILADERVENVEDFTVAINTSDTSLLLTRSVSTITIEDSSGNLHFYLFVNTLAL